MDPLMINRIFDEIDQQGSKMETLSKITYANSATLGMLSKMVLVIITFLIVAGLTASYNLINTRNIHNSVNKSITKQEMNKKENKAIVILPVNGVKK